MGIGISEFVIDEAFGFGDSIGYVIYEIAASRFAVADRNRCLVIGVGIAVFLVEIDAGFGIEE